MKIKPFFLRGGRWNEVDKSALGDEFALIKRKKSPLAARMFGSFATAIDVPVSELPERVVKEIILKQNGTKGDN